MLFYNRIICILCYLIGLLLCTYSGGFRYVLPVRLNMGPTKGAANFLHAGNNA